MGHDHPDGPPAATKQPPTPPAGFTLIEMSVVLAVTAMVASMITPVYLAWIEAGWNLRTRTELANLADAATSYALDHSGSLPADLTILTAADGGPEGTPYYLVKDQSLVNGLPVDPWGTPYAYAVEGPFTALISSAGENRSFDDQNGDDIVATCDLSPVLREQTEVELAEVNLAIRRYNAIKLPDEPLPGSIGDLIATLVDQGFLTGQAGDFLEDSWGQPFIPSGNPVFQVLTAGAPEGG